ncbi:MAG: DUF167 domain-containing protein [Armatimonadota bacterium]|nr:MAG: DUF167 domain-containing protein [Armatimonadota bacterium]
MPGWLTRDGDDILLALRVQPRAGRDAIAGPHGDRLRIRIAAAPVDDAANERLCCYIADLFGVPQGRVSVMRGRGGREKLVRVAGAGGLPEELARWMTDP